MTIKELLYNLLLLILALAPISLIIVELLDKTLYKKTKDISKATVLLTSTSKNLIKNYFIVKNIIYDDQQIKVNNDQNKFSIHTQNKPSKALTHSLPQNQNLELLNLITKLCSFPKIKKIENTIQRFFKMSRFKNNSLSENFTIINKVPKKLNPKFSTIIVQKKDSKEIFALSKGNPFQLLKHSTRILNKGKKEELSPEKKRKLKKQIERLNKKGQKVIAYTYRALPLKKRSVYDEDFTEKELIFIGLISVRKPINREIRKSIIKTKALNLKIYLTTQIKEKNALAIAKELKIIDPENTKTISGTNLKKLSQKQLKHILKDKTKDYIFYKIQTKQKQLIAKTLQEINEKPLIINNKLPFQKVIDAFKKRQEIKKNKAKTLIHSLSLNPTLFLLILTSLLLKTPPILNLQQLLLLHIFINLSLTLSIRANKNSTTSFTKKQTKIQTIFLSILSLILALTLYIWNLYRLGWSPSSTFTQSDLIHTNTSTLLFAFLAIIQTIKAIQLSKTTLKKQNPFLLSTSIIILLILYIIIKFPSLNSFFQTISLSLTEIKILATSLALFILVPIIFKYAFKHQSTK